MQIYAAGGLLPNRKWTIMNKTIRYLALFLCIVLNTISMHVQTVHAEEKVVFSVGSERGESGDTVIIPIDIRNSGQVATLDITVVYDPAELSFVSASKGDAVKDGNICDINPIPEKACIRFVFSSLKEISEDGNVMELTFQVLRDKTEDHTVDLNVIDVFDMDIQELSWTVEGGREIAPMETDSSKEQEPAAEGIQFDSKSKKTFESYEQQSDSSQSKSDRRFFARTEDGIKDVTDTMAGRTNEDLLNEGSALAESEEVNNRASDTDIIYSVALCAAIILLIVAGVVVYTIRKRKK